MVGQGFKIVKTFSRPCQTLHISYLSPFNLNRKHGMHNGITDYTQASRVIPFYSLA